MPTSPSRRQNKKPRWIGELVGLNSYGVTMSLEGVEVRKHHLAPEKDHSQRIKRDQFDDGQAKMRDSSLHVAHAIVV